MQRLRILIVLSFLLIWGKTNAQLNTERIMQMGRNALYYEDYVLSIQRFNMVINAKPNIAEPYFYRGLAKFYLDDYVGADLDCTNAIFRNPYAPNYYVLRGLCRINQKHFDTAEQDYQNAININPMDETSWHNMVLCQMHLEEYNRADSCLDIMIRRWPKSSENCTMKAQVKFSQKDTVNAEDWIDRALDINAFCGPALSMKAMLHVKRGNYKDGETMLDKAIVQMPRNTDLYINRALVRYNQDNLRGAMSDYDAALEINPNNYVGHFNRGLLRSQVGDDNNAIEDFNFVLDKEPDNYIALYNRVLLLNNVGKYKDAIHDINIILKEYPEFWDGYSIRASMRRKLGDIKGAELDEFKVLKARIEYRYSKKSNSKKTRKKNNNNIDDYTKLVEEEETEQLEKYESEFRGRVQNRQTTLQLRPLFVLTYFKSNNQQNHYMPFLDEVYAMNNKGITKHTVYLTNMEANASEQMLKGIFNEIAIGTEKIENSIKENKETDNNELFRRALNSYIIRDFETGLTDIENILKTDSTNTLALMMRSQLKTASLLTENSNINLLTDTENVLTTSQKLTINNIIEELQALIKIQPKNQYALYNQANLYAMLREYDKSIEIYTKCINLDNVLPDAYYNRGIIEILANKTEQGLADLSQAGEYGIYTAYNLIKKYSKRNR